MLILVVHTVPEVTAKVAFSTIQLQDLVITKKVPQEFRCRQLVPSSGKRSVSLWDCQDSEALLTWLKESVTNCEHEIFEVQEDFAVGMGEISRQRATDKVTAGTRDVAKAVGGTVHDIDSRYKISDRANHAVDAVKESAVVQSTAAAFGRGMSSVKNASKKLSEQPAVAHATEAVGSSFKKLGATFSSLTGRNSGTNAPESMSPLSHGATNPTAP